MKVIVVGVLNLNECEDFIYDEIHNGVDLTYEEFVEDLNTQGLSDEEFEDALEDYESDSDNTVLFGDWNKIRGKYSVNKQGTNGFSATYQGGTICVEYSKTTKKCGPTSPCFRMVNGGACGDLNTPRRFSSILLT